MASLDTAELSDEEFNRRQQAAGRVLAKMQEDRDSFFRFKGYEGETSSPYTIQNVLWIMASIAVFYYSEIALVILYDVHVNRSWLYAGGILFIITLCIAGFLIVWLTCIKNVPTSKWEEFYPAAIPTATASFLFGSICLNVALWPIWHFLTPVYLFVMFMGLIVLIAMIPSTGTPVPEYSEKKLS